MKKPFIILVILIVVALLVVGCNPDQIMKAGQLMGNLSDAGLVSRNTKYVDEATENVAGFIEESELAFNWPGSLIPDDYDIAVPFNDGDEGEALFLSTVDDTVTYLLAARDSSAKDDSLRAALNARYEGHTDEEYILTSKNLYAGIKRERKVGVILHVVETALESPERSNMAFVLSMLGLRGVTVDTVEEAIDTIKETNLPFPLQSYDYALLVGKLFEQLKTIQEAIQSSSSAGGGKNIDMDILRRFQKDITTTVGEREYQTVGDKIAVGTVYSILKKVIALNDAYKDPKYNSDDPAQRKYYYACEEGHKYDLFATFILTEPEGKDGLDGILGCLDAISYIYGVKLDMAGLVAGLV